MTPTFVETRPAPPHEPARRIFASASRTVLLLAFLAQIACGGGAARKPIDAPNAPRSPIDGAGKAPVSADDSLDAAILAEAQRQIGPLLELAPESSDYLSALAMTLGRYSPRPDLDFRVTVIDSQEAWTLSGTSGAILVSSGLLKVARNEAELAGAIAHEIAHVCAGDLVSFTGGRAGADSTEAKIEAAKKVLFKAGYSQETEYQADKVGTEIASMTGYNPWGLKRLCASVREARLKGGWQKILPSADYRTERLDETLDAQYGDFTALPWNVKRYTDLILDPLSSLKRGKTGESERAK